MMTKTQLEYALEDMQRMIKRCTPVLTSAPGEYIAAQEEAMINRLSLDVTRALKDLRAEATESVPSGR